MLQNIKRGALKMKKRVFYLLTGLLLMVAIPNVFAEETDSRVVEDSSVPPVSSVQKEKIDSGQSEEVTKETSIEDYKAAKIRMVQVYYANGYITKEKHDEAVGQVNAAKTKDEIETIMNNLIDSVDNLTDFTFSFTEKYYNLEANIYSAIKKGMITENQAQPLLDRLVIANTIDELKGISDDLNSLINGETTSTTSTSSSSSEGTSQISESKTQPATTETTNKGVLPKTGEGRGLFTALLGSIIISSSMGLILFKRK